MTNSFDKEKESTAEMKRDMERIKAEFGKGMSFEEIADKLNMAKEYVEFLFWFGIV